jgi:hypothetical protein
MACDRAFRRRDVDIPRASGSVMVPALLPARSGRLRPAPAALALAMLAVIIGLPSACAQTAPLAQTLAAAAPTAAPPPPVYWKQNLFLIPYQWSSAADPGGAQAVWLFVSKDAGATWQKISEAKPQVRAFTYRAEQDGQYWFAIRTIDHNGRAWPDGPYQPELQVIVDTTRPRIEELTGLAHDDGTLEVKWRAVDRNIAPDSWKIEVQTDADQWYPVPLPAVGNAALDVSAGQTTWTAPVGTRPTALRSVVYDRAGNAAIFGTSVRRAPAASEDTSQTPTAVGTRGDLPLAGASGWMSGSAPTPRDQNAIAAAPQSWPASSVERAPFRLFGGAADSAADAATTYGRPPGVGQPLVVSAGNDATPPLPLGEGRSEGALPPLPLGEGRGEGASRSTVTRADPLIPVAEARPTFAPLEPFREASLSRLPPVGESAERGDMPPSASVRPDSAGGQLPPGVEPKQVPSRTFALQYELQEVGRWGVSKVELWGTRDGGRSWHLYATDDDNRSPLQVTVDGEGLYGFRIVVYSAAGTATFPPQSGDQPELWVAVDLHRPTVELTAIEPGSGNQADYLILRWRAEDDNLQPRPISLFYSSRPAGPWSAVATNLQNTGEYAWRLERHLPARFYLRLEARDTAGNLAAYQTAEPVLLQRPQPTGHLQGVRPLNSAARSPLPLGEG